LVKRFLSLSILFILLVCLSLYGKYHHPWINLQMCQKNPKIYDGHTVTSFSEPRIGQIYSDGFQLIQKDSPPIRVLADTAGLETGEFVGLKAVFHDEGYLTAVSIHVAHYRRSKIWISVIPAVIVLFFMIRYFRLNIKKYQIELRSDA
jgi:hypothetical protein